MSDKPPAFSPRNNTILLIFCSIVIPLVFATPFALLIAHGSQTIADSKPPAALKPLDAAAIAKAKDRFQKLNCAACHKEDSKLVGPGLKEIAVKYAGDAGAQATLEKKVKDGGQGTWGQIPMPPNPTATNDDVQLLVRWILSLK